MTLSPFRPKVPGWTDSEALIKEARRLRRRRLLIGSFLAALLLLLSGLGLLAARHGTARKASEHPNQSVPPTIPPPKEYGAKPFVDATGFKNNGNLAFVSRNQLWVLDGSKGSLQMVASPYAEDPKFSADGKWLAYLTYAPLNYPGIGPTAGQLWIARSDGTDPHKIAGLSDVSAILWSPKNDLLAASGSKPGIFLVSTSGTVHEIPGTSHASNFVWSPDGTEIAYSGWSQHGALRTVPISGGASVLWESTYNNPRYPKSSNPNIPAAWLPNGGGILFWIDPQNSGSIAMDGLSLYLLKKPQGRLHLLGTTLVSPSAIAVNDAGAIAITSGAGRYQWSNKKVEICSARTASCSAVSSKASQVTFDPYWEESGKTLIYSEGPDNGQSPFPQSGLSKWYSELTLRKLNVTDNTSSEVRGSSGGAISLASSSGKDLLYESRDALWIKSNGSASPVEIESPLFPPNSWPTSYAEVDWSDQFSWNQ